MLSSSTESRLNALIGLEGAKRLVQKLASHPGGPHAVLFYGSPGAGKGLLADALTEGWLCQNRGENGACGECKACITFAKGANPDVLRVSPQGASRIIRVGQVVARASEDADIPIQTFFRTGPIMSACKVVNIDDAHRMNTDAANALLKTLEEPHPFAKLILTTSAVGGILPTIVSRCLAVACQSASPAEVTGITPEAREEDFRLSGGTPGSVRRILEHAELYRPLDAFATDLLTYSAAHALLASDRFRELSDALAKGLDCGARAANAEALERLGQSLANRPEVPPPWLGAIARAHARIIGNGNAGLVLDALFTRILRERTDAKVLT